MNTIAIWYDPKSSSSTDSELDIHVNFWKVKKSTLKTDYLLDLGLMVYDKELTNEIYIHFPFKITRNDIKDLGNVLLNDDKAVNSIFNENYDIHNAGNNSKQKNIQNNSKQTLFNIYALDLKDSSNDIDLKPEFGGTTLVIKTSTIPLTGDCNKYYFRFRLKGPFLKNFIRQHVPDNWFFQSAMTNTDAIDFRINEKRNFDESLAETISTKKIFLIKKIHFLLMRKAADDIIADHLNITCRELEKDWKNYVGNEYDIENIIAYHWSEKYDEINKTNSTKYLESFNTLVKVKYHKSNWRTILIYLIIVGIISVGFNLLSNVIYSKIDKNNDLEQIKQLIEKNCSMPELEKVLNLDEGEKDENK